MRHDDDLDDTDDELELEDDTDDFDDDGILKDSHSVRVPLRFMDSVQRAIHLDAANHMPTATTPIPETRPRKGAMHTSSGFRVRIERLLPIPARPSVRHEN
jgi:hypothetical protein